ncbi:SoxR reducing system RseC family protein [Crassaminicella thermophila]|uniref:SoxR reducing system RseC family protein n=1 Tax=Crassaminicella thermophila TaxID=2599308 RepID=A0A5C0SGJ8_CRATE|nr:SoxR reducing system RseC family protein [Crassaminicella thermophila]QEK12079.1 SoxR reducing system RseC family protein [Crassaminicella thermophila]
MIQVGKVVEILDSKRAKVLMRKHAACGECGACQHGDENMNLNIIAVNEINAEVGDIVEVNMETQNVLGAAFIVYVIPLFAMILGIGIGSYLFKKMGVTVNLEIYAICLGFVLTAIAYLAIKSREGSFKKDKRYMPVISKILD